MKHILAAAALLALCIFGHAEAQAPGSGGNVNASGTVTNGQCAVFTGVSYNVLGGSCGSGGSGVSSFNTRTGAVVPTSGDYSFSLISGTATLGQLAAEAANTVVGNGTGSTAAPTAVAVPSCSTATSALQWTSGTGFGCATIAGGVTSFNTRTGAIVPASGDYSFSLISGSLALAQLPSEAANTLLGALTATTPSALAVPSCSTANNFLQWTSGTGFGCATSSGGVAISGTPAATNLAQFTNSTTVKGVSQGVFNVRLMYGAVPDGSTDNSTAITNAFTASNAYTNGTPTVYFDCDTGATTCVYNYTGSGNSPIAPTIATTIKCAQGVTINYLGTAHAADIGNQSLSAAYPNRYTIDGCRWTGGASYTAGFYFYTYNIETWVTNNEFFQFGNQTAYSLVYNGNSWSPTIMGNTWVDHDGVSRNMLDAHTATNTNINFTNNRTECFTSGGGACSNSTYGVGVWLFTGQIINNVIAFHGPEIRISSCQTCGGGAGIYIQNNQLEDASALWPTPGITFGDPGTTGVNIDGGNVVFIDHNIFTGISKASAVPWIGPETASSGNFTLQNLNLTNNNFAISPGTGAVYVNVGGVGGAYSLNNWHGAVLINQSTSPTVFNAGATSVRYGPSSFIGNGGALANSPVAFDSSGVNIVRSSFHNASSILTCPDVSGSGTAQSCVTTPEFDSTGTKFTPAAGDMILYKTTTTVTGDDTINVNATSAVHVRKFGGTTTLAAGDIVAGVYYPLVFDGTFWDMQQSNLVMAGYTVATLPSTVATGQVTGAQAYVTDAVACTFLATLTGGGSTVCPVFYNGTAWVGA